MNAPVRPLRLFRPTLDTRLHIDYDWWGRNDREWRVYLSSHLCPEHRAIVDTEAADEQIDWVQADTGEVRPVDRVQHALITHCSQQPGYITPQTALVDAVFRVFLANGNTPMTIRELAERTGRPAETILRTLGGTRVYKGLRPLLD
ncbi:MAG: hypothetical protein ABSG98_12890 [Anaerolineales bacterium]